ncbi:hypothetical protein [Negadavirga shengliensis]|uniref:Outer membrane protein beta-barrel domain-containing protein n=1 Tax=Negadavirga shengliensis TaxID=1389218 RepID=A0ABV9T7A3_9BACT
MKSLFSYIGLTITLFLVSYQLSAQDFYKEKIPRNYYYQGGIGLGTMYADNGGSIRMFNVKVRPSLSGAVGRKISRLVDLKTYMGYQNFQSQDIDYFNPNVVNLWKEWGQAVESRGNVFYMDLMPTVNLFKSNSHTDRKDFNLYMGTGLGVLINFSNETRLENENRVTTSHDHFAAYIPVRGGISYRLDIYSDIAIEGSLMFTFSDHLDGNEGFNRFNDHLLNGQIIYRRYILSRKSMH